MLRRLAFDSPAVHLTPMRIVPYVETRGSYAAPWARRAAMLSFTTLLVGLLAHWLKIMATPAFFWTMALVAALALCALALAAIGLPKVWNRGYRGGRDIVVAAVFGSIVLAPFAVAAGWAFTHPPLTDISTDLDDPPLFLEAIQGRSADMNPILTAGEEWKVEQLDAYPNVAGRRYDVPIENVRAAAERTFDARGWGILGPYIVGTGTEFNMETIVYSPVLALPSDVVVRLIEEGDATFVDMRSASRFGETDFGQNADLIQSFLKDLDIAVATLTPVAPSQ